MWKFPESVGDLQMALDISASQTLACSYTSPIHSNSLLPNPTESHPKPRGAIFLPSKTWSSLHMHYPAHGHHIQGVCYGKNPTKTPVWSFLSNKGKPVKTLLKCVLLEVQHLPILSTAVREQIQPLTFCHWKTALSKSYPSSLISGLNKSSSSSFLHSSRVLDLWLFFWVSFVLQCVLLSLSASGLPEWHNKSPCASRDFPANTC